MSYLYDYINLFPRPKKEDQKVLDECTRRLIKESKEHPIELKLWNWPGKKKE